MLGEGEVMELALGQMGLKQLAVLAGVAAGVSRIWKGALWTTPRTSDAKV